MRQLFISRIDRYDRMISGLSKEPYNLKVANTTNQTVTVRPSEIFYSMMRIRDESGIRKTDSEEVKVKKIYAFLKNRWAHSVPLFESKRLHETPYFMSVYGSGYCDDAASTFIYLLNLEGIQCRSWWLKGHVIAEVNYSGAWHAFDIDTLGYFEKDGRILSFDEWIPMARQGLLTPFNEVIMDTPSHKIKMPDRLFLKNKMGDPELVIYPGEERIYYKKLWGITHQGDNLDPGAFADPEILYGSYPQLANFTRNIPLKHAIRADGTVEISDYFPFTGLFILTTADPDQDKGQMPLVAVNYDFPTTPSWIPLADTGLRLNGRRVLNGSAAVGNLGLAPSHTMALGNLLQLLKLDPEASLLTVHFYAANNMHCDAAASTELRKAGLTVGS